MANTYIQLYIHIVFSVKARHALIPKHHKSKLHQYITGIITKRKQKVIQINSMPDHIHILVGMTPDIALSDLVQSIKIGSTRFINRQGWIAGKFQWQEGFGAFSYSRSQLNTVAAYIENQEEHHSQRTFHEEYLEFLKRFNVPYDPKYVFDLETPIKTPRR
jgi:REP element-mobilizing transposase RayT